MTTKEKSPYIISFEKLRNRVPNPSKLNEPMLEFSPLSGSEPKYDPNLWNQNPDIKDTHNCYAYVLNKIVKGRKDKPQPGYFSNYPYIEEKDYRCSTFYKRLKRDIPSLYLTTFNEPCSKGFYKGFIAIDPKKDDQDYHFYRQNSDGYWSHKPGRTDVINYDSEKNKIKNPLLANRKYKYFNYSEPCFFFCVKSGLGRIESNPLNESFLSRKLKNKNKNFMNEDIEDDSLYQNNKRNSWMNNIFNNGENEGQNGGKRWRRRVIKTKKTAKSVKSAKTAKK